MHPPPHPDIMTSWTPLWPVVVAFGLTSLTGAPAWAGSALLRGPSTPVEVANQALESALPDAPDPEKTLSVAELPIGANPPLIAVGSKQGTECPQGRTAPSSWLPILADAQTALDGLEYDKVLQILAPAIETLPCSSQVLDPAAPSRMFMLQGLAHFFLEDPAQARASFRAAIALDRNLQWDNNYPPNPRQSFLDAREDSLRAGTARVQVVAARGEVSQLVIDGASVLDSASRGVEILSGHHLIQYRMSDGTFHTSLVVVGGGETRLLVTRAGAAEAVLLGARQDEMTYAVRAINSFVCRELGVDTLYVVDGVGAERYLYRFSQAGGRFDRLLAPGAGGSNGGNTPTILVEGLLVLPNSLPEGSPPDTVVTAEGTRLQGAVRIYVGDQAAPTFARDGNRATFTVPPGLRPGVYNVRVVYSDGKDYVSPLAFSIQSDPRRNVLPEDVKYVTVETIIKADRLRLGVRWGAVIYQDEESLSGEWGDLSLDFNVRMGGGFCINAGGGFYAREPGGADDPRGYVFAGFKARWYPRIVQTFIGVQYLHVLGSGSPGKGTLGVRGVMGVDVIIPGLNGFFFTVELGGALMIDQREPYGWFNGGGGVGVRF